MDISQFLVDRLKFEASRAGRNLRSSAEEHSVPDDAGLEGKCRKVSEIDNKAIQPTGACAPGTRQISLCSPSDENYLSPLACLG